MVVNEETSNQKTNILTLLMST